MRSYIEVLRRGVLLAGIVLVPAAHAALILVGPNPDSGQGLGAVSTILTIQSQGQNQEETGCISPTGSSGCGFANNTVQASSQVRNISGIAAANLRFVFNASEPGSDNLITLNQLVLTVYNGSTAIFSTVGLRDSNGALINPATGRNFDPFSGTGNSGYLFRLSTSADGDPQAEALQAEINAQGANATITVGLGARLTNASGGLETFSFRAFTPSQDEPPIPEPATYVLVGSALVAGVLFTRRRSKLN